jgi:hypothetical protein
MDFTKRSEEKHELAIPGNLRQLIQIAQNLLEVTELPTPSNKAMLTNCLNALHTLVPQS